MKKHRKEFLYEKPKPKIAPQLYCSRREPPKPPSPEDIKPIKNFMFNKPEGGLWTSTFLPEGEEFDKMCSDWLRWCLSDMPEWLPKSEDYCWVLYPSDDVKVFEIDTLDDYIKCLEKYGYLNPTTKKREINFEKLQMDYDCLHLTEGGFWGLRYIPEYPEYQTFYGWDCESTIWFRWKFKISILMLYEMSYLRRRDQRFLFGAHEET